MEPKVVLMHGFSQDDAVTIMRAVKAAYAVPENIAFAMSTESNLEWPISRLVGELTEEWNYFRTHKPEES